MRSRRRGVTLLMVIGMVTIMMMFATMLMTQAGQRYHHAQLVRDRLQANHCAQAGLLWAQGRLRAGEDISGTHSLTLGAMGTAEITAMPEGNAWRLVAVGTALRDASPQATRRLERVIGCRP